MEDNKGFFMKGVRCVAAEGLRRGQRVRWDVASIIHYVPIEVV